MAPTPWWGFCQTLLHPGRGMEQSRGAGSAPIPIPAVSTAAQRCGVSLCLCNVSLCLVPPLFIAIYRLFIILPTTTPAVFIIERSPCCSGTEGVPPSELAPAAPGVGGSGDIQALSPLVSLPWGVGQKGKQRLAEEGICVPPGPVLSQGPSPSPRLQLCGSHHPSRHWKRHRGCRVRWHRSAVPSGVTAPGREAGRSLNPLNSLTPPGPRDFQNTDGHAWRARSLGPVPDRCPRSIAGPGRAPPVTESAALIPHRDRQRAPPARPDRCRRLITR